MPVQRYNAELTGLQSSQFQGRAEAQFSWQKAVGMYLLLPGIRRFWPMSAFDSFINALDLVANTTLNDVGNIVYGLDGLAPYVELDGIGDRLWIGDSAAYDILGTESFIGTPGLTIGCWFYPEDKANWDDLMTKWGAVGQRSYYLILNGGAAGDPLAFYISDDGTNHDNAANTNTVYNAWNFGVGRFNDADTGAELASFVNDTVVTAATARNSIHNSTASFMIGSSTAGGSLFTGNVSLAFLCASALPDYMINALYHHTKTMFGHV